MFLIVIWKKLISIHHYLIF